MKLLKKLLLIILLSGILLVLAVGSIYFWVGASAKSHIYTEIADIPEYDVAVVLGTSRNTIYGTENLFFKYRMDAAAELYHHGKVKKLLVSGDNRRREYNEPMDMKRALINRGVNEKDIVLDYAGFRTFDSMVRALKIFRQESFIVVSQPFHLERAIFIAKSKNMKVIGYPAKDPGFGTSRVYLREVPARVKAFLDCYILNTQPYFLGEEESI